MERKVIQLAGKTLVVSIPSAWVKKYGIKKGDTLYINEKDKEICISTSKEKEFKKREIILSGPPELIRRNVDVAYKKGIDIAEFKFESPSIRKEIEKALQSTMGFEIISHKKESCTVKSIASAIEGEFDNILRKIFLTLISMSEEIHEAVKNKDSKMLEEIPDYEKTINKLTNFCKRTLNKNGSKNGQSNYKYCIVWELERIGDEFNKIYSLLSKEKNISVSKETTAVFEDAKLFLREFYNLFYKFNEKSAISFTSRKKKIEANSKELIKKTKGNETLIIAGLASVIKSVYDIAGPYYAMIL